jgi:O-antigen/teichoic acid export membrane protein
MLVKLVKSNTAFIRYNAFSYSIIIINILTTIITVKANLGILHKELYGIWLLVFSTINILGVLNFGFTSLAVIKFEEYKKAGKLTYFFSNNFALILLQIFLAGFCFILLTQFSFYFIKNEQYVQLFNLLLSLALPGIILNVFSAYIEAILFYNLKFVYHRNIVELLRLSIMSIIASVVLIFTNDIIFMPIVFSAMSFLTFLYSMYKFLKRQNVEIDVHQISIKYMSIHVYDSLSFWVLNISSVVISQIDVFFISMMRQDVGQITMYSQSFRLQEIALRFIKKMTEIKAPKVLAFYNAGNNTAIVNIYNKLLVISFLASFFACLSIAIFGKYLLETWLAKEVIFDNQVIIVTSILCISGSIHYVLWNFCNLTGQQKKVKNIVIVEILLNLMLSFVFMKYFGLIGLATASFISNSITILYVYLIFKKFQKAL